MDINFLRNLYRFGTPIQDDNTGLPPSAIMDNWGQPDPNNPDPTASDPSAGNLQRIYDPNSDDNSDTIAPSSSSANQSQSQDPSNGTFGISTPIMDAYRQTLLQAPPTREKLTMLHRIFAGMAAMSPATSPAEIEAIKYPQYTKDKAAYDQRVKQLGEGAGTEERYVSNQRLTAASDSRAQRDLQRMQDAKDKSDKEYQLKEQTLQQNLQIANDKLDQAKNVADQRQGNAEATLNLREAEMAAVKARHELDIAQRDRQLDETKRLNDARIQKMNDDNKTAQDRIKALEDSIAARNSDKSVTTTEEKPLTGFQKVEKFFGMNPEPEKKSKTTTTVYDKNKGTQQIPAGAKPGGQWITLPSDQKVYQEP